MSKRKIEILEDLKTDPPHSEGDIVSIETSKADRFIAAGWAKDAETGETGDRVPGSAPVVPDDTTAGTE